MAELEAALPSPTETAAPTAAASPIRVFHTGGREPHRSQVFLLSHSLLGVVLNRQLHVCSVSEAALAANDEKEFRSNIASEECLLNVVCVRAVLPAAGDVEGDWGGVCCVAEDERFQLLAVCGRASKAPASKQNTLCLQFDRISSSMLALSVLFLFSEILLYDSQSFTLRQTLHSDSDVGFYAAAFRGSFSLAVDVPAVDVPGVEDNKLDLDTQHLEENQEDLETVQKQPSASVADETLGSLLTSRLDRPLLAVSAWEACPATFSALPKGTAKSASSSSADRGVASGNATTGVPAGPSSLTVWDALDGVALLRVRAAPLPVFRLQW